MCTKLGKLNKAVTKSGQNADCFMATEHVLSLVKLNDHHMLRLLVKIPRYLQQNDMGPALLHACKYGLLECTDCLISSGVDVECEDASGNQPLHHSVSGNHPLTTMLLLEAGANPNKKGSSRNYPLHIAAKGNMEECMVHLITFKAHLNARDSAGQTPLIVATRERRFAAIQLLLKSGCDLNCQDNNGWTALHYASQLGTAVDILMAAGADPDICDNNRCTPLLLAATEGFSHIVKLLCRYKCNPNISNHFVNKTPLHILAFKGHPECLPDLLRAGADVSLLDSEGRSPLWYAVDNSCIEVVKILLRADSQVDTYQCGSDLPTEACPVRLAVLRGNVGILKLFIIVGFDTAHLRECLQEESLSNQLTCDLSSWLPHAHDVMTLKLLCRRWIRHHSGTRLMSEVSLLPLPTGLIDFLLLKELDDIHL